MIPYTVPMTARRIPVIDFADAFSPELARREALAWEIHKISRDVGFFYLVNHGVAPALVEGSLICAAFLRLAPGQQIGHRHAPLALRLRIRAHGCPGPR
jgi:hypothetical protein